MNKRQRVAIAACAAAVVILGYVCVIRDAGVDFPRNPFSNSADPAGQSEGRPADGGTANDIARHGATSVPGVREISVKKVRLIGGRVISDAGYALASASLHLRCADSQLETTADEDGRFRFLDIAEPTWMLVVAAQGHLSRTIEGNGYGMVGDVVLERSRTLEIIVRSASGAPLSGAKVSLWPIEARYEVGATGVELLEIPSWFSGKVTACAPGHLRQEKWVGSAARLEFILEEAPTIKGKIVAAETLLPVVGAIVTYNGTDYACGANGEFSLSVQSGGRVALAISGNGFASTERIIDASKETNLLIRLESAGSLRWHTTAAPASARWRAEFSPGQLGPWKEAVCRDGYITCVGVPIRRRIYVEVCYNGISWQLCAMAYSAGEVEDCGSFAFPETASLSLVLDGSICAREVTISWTSDCRSEGDFIVSPRERKKYVGLWLAGSTVILGEAAIGEVSVVVESQGASWSWRGQLRDDNTIHVALQGNAKVIGMITAPASVSLEGILVLAVRRDSNSVYRGVADSSGSWSMAVPDGIYDFFVRGKMVGCALPMGPSATEKIGGGRAGPIVIEIAAETAHVGEVEAPSDALENVVGMPIYLESVDGAMYESAVDSRGRFKIPIALDRLSHIRLGATTDVILRAPWIQQCTWSRNSPGRIKIVE